MLLCFLSKDDKFVLSARLTSSLAPGERFVSLFCIKERSKWHLTGIKQFQDHLEFSIEPFLLFMKLRSTYGRIVFGETPLPSDRHKEEDWQNNCQRRFIQFYRQLSQAYNIPHRTLASRTLPSNVPILYQTIFHSIAFRLRSNSVINSYFPALLVQNTLHNFLDLS